MPKKISNFLSNLRGRKMSKDFVPRTTADRNSVVNSVESSPLAESPGTHTTMPIPEIPTEEGNVDTDPTPSLTASEEARVLERGIEVATENLARGKSGTFTPRRPEADRSLTDGAYGVSPKHFAMIHPIHGVNDVPPNPPGLTAVNAAISRNGNGMACQHHAPGVGMPQNYSIRNPYSFIPGNGINGMSSMASHPTMSGFHPSAPDLNSKQCEPQTAFITYVKDETSLEAIRHLADVLISNGVVVKIDFYDKKMMGMGINQWINDNIEEADHIIVCINKSYKSAVSETSGATSENVKHAIAVYNRLQTILINANSMNYRILPVVVGNATQDDVPLAFQNTFIYRWPQEFEKIIRRVFKIPELKPPALGMPPRMVLDTCSNIRAK